MSEGLPIIEKMEAVLARLLTQAEAPALAAEPPRSLPVPGLDELLRAAVERLQATEQQAQAIDAQLAAAAQGLTAWRERLGGLRRRLAQYDKGDDQPAARVAG